MKHSRNRGRALGALAAVACGAVALPAAADAATVAVQSNGELVFTAGRNELNRVTLVRPNPFTVEVQDGVPLQAGAGCVQANVTLVRCTGSTRASIGLGNLDDTLSVGGGSDYLVRASGESGNDAFVGGRFPQPSRTIWIGADGIDTANYFNADRTVHIIKDGESRDGRVNVDRDSIRADTEVIQGSQFDDILVGDNGDSVSEVLIGGAGNDTMDGRLGFEVFDEGPVRNGGDLIVGGADGGRVDYGDRSAGITATINENGGRPGDDGESGEGDNLVNVTQVDGGRGDDAIRASEALGAVFVRGFAGADTIIGSRFGDRLVGGGGRDSIFGLAGNDTLLNADESGRLDDGLAETLSCGPDQDGVTAGAGDTFTECESRGVGVLRVATARTAAAGQTHAVRLSWTHPESWRRLRSVELRVLDENGATVGSATVLPRTAGVKADGPVLDLRRNRVSLLRDGRKRVTARVLLRPDEALAGRRLSLEVEATDSQGRRQVQAAGRIVVAG